MSSNAKIVGGILAGAGISYLLFTKHGKELTEQLAENSKSFFDDAKDKFSDTKDKVADTKDDFRENISNKVFEFATDHKSEIASLATAVVPILLKAFVKNKI